MEKLKMTASKTEGSFVKTLTGQTGTGFSQGTHIHKDWYAQTIGYDDALELAHDAVRNREDIVTPAKNICGSVNTDGQFILKVNGRDFIPTDHAIEQFSTRAGVPSSTILRELRKQEDFDSNDGLVMSNLANNAIRRLNPDKQYRVRTYTDGTCRAFVTDKYAPVDNRWYLETLREFLPEGRLSHWRSDEDTLFGNILLPDSVMDYDQDDSDYGSMISIGNCEIGKRVISQRPSLFRSICMNGCIWGQVSGQNIRRRHIGNIDLRALKVQIGENIEHQLPLLPNAITQFLATRQFTNHSTLMKNIIAAISFDSRFNKNEASIILNEYNTYESQDRNLFGVINSITRAGQKLDNASWVKFDEIGGNLLNMNTTKWSSVLRKADSLQDRELEKIFGLSL